MPDVTVETLDKQASFGAYLAVPAKATEKVPGLVLIQEIFGVNANMRHLANQFAEFGYLTICPDLFWRQQPGIQLTDKTPGDWDKAVALMKGMDQDKAVEDLAAAMHYVRTHPMGRRKAGCVGYCLGGKLAVLMATRTDCDASVSYYGVSLDQIMGEFKQIEKPLLMHVAEKDRFAPPKIRGKYENMLRLNPFVQYFVYPEMDHAFAREGGDHFNSEAATLAEGRTRAFLKKNLA